MKMKSGMSVVEASILLAILALILAISIPALFQNQQKKRVAECAMNLDSIATACKKFAAEKGGFPKNLSSLVPTCLESVPTCPSGGTYSLGTPEGDPPTCSIPEHSL